MKKKIKIIKPDSRPNTWYNNCIGNIYCITREVDGGYFTRNKDTDGYLGFVNKEDCIKVTYE